MGEYCAAAGVINEKGDCNVVFKLAGPVDLDSPGALTEKQVMDAVNNLSKHKTIIMIAHRLSTVKNCDKIFLFEKGELKNEGTFDELINKNENFKKSVIN